LALIIRKAQRLTGQIMEGEIRRGQALLGDGDA
jgi:hypothetical protein